jgi:hypothetical protein
MGLPVLQAHLVRHHPQMIDAAMPDKSSSGDV